MKYKKSPFSDDPLEASHMIGFRAGDLSAAIYGFQVRVSTTSTHPAMWRMFRETFGKYGRVGKSASLSKGYYSWCVYSYLDRSFSFLLDKPKTIPDEILNDQAKFLSFLAGYVDAEGFFSLKADAGKPTACLRINSEDEAILRQLTSRLRSMGYHVYFSLASPEGYHGTKKYNRNLWEFGMFRTTEVVDLVRLMPMVHDEKRRMVNLILKASEGEYSDPQEEAFKLKSAIRDEVASFTSEARISYDQKHGVALKT
jgi:hypothetical protein